MLKSNAYIRLLLALVFTIVLAGTSCVRYKVASHTRDTLYIKQFDTTGVRPKDSLATAKRDTIIETVFVEIEKDCQQVPKEKLNTWKKRIQEPCTMEGLTGGELKASSPDLRSKVTFYFKGDSPPVAVWEIEAMEILDKEVKAPDIGFWDQVRHTWQFWLWQTLFAILWIFFKVRKIFT